MRSILALLLFALAVSATPARAGSFDLHHPDQYFRKLGFEAYDKREYGSAADSFRRAAYYADKSSQLVLALLYLDGEGVDRDPALAYAWADVASERGYQGFLRVREQIWAKLDEAQQQRAIDEGAKLYATYGDAVAKKRLDARLRQGLAGRTGSRTGSKVSAAGVAQMDPSARAALTAAFQTSPFMQGAAGESSMGMAENMANLLVKAMGSLAGHTVVGYYEDQNWKPADYWQFQDQIWGMGGIVEVQPLRIPHRQEKD